VHELDYYRLHLQTNEFRKGVNKNGIFDRRNLTQLGYAQTSSGGARPCPLLADIESRVSGGAVGTSRHCEVLIDHDSLIFIRCRLWLNPSTKLVSYITLNAPHALSGEIICRNGNDGAACILFARVISTRGNNVQN